MKQLLNKTFILFILLGFILTGKIFAKDSASALKHMNELTGPSEQIGKETLAYVQAIAHSKNPSLVENKRRAIIVSVEKAILNANQAVPYDGNSDYKNSVIKYLNTMYTILKEDYGKLVNMQEVSEESYDAMEAYMLAKKKANEKLKEIGDELKEKEKEFASNNNINLIEQQDPTSIKLKKASEVLNYQGIVYLVDFKSYKQEMYLLDALNKNDINGIEQNRSTLQKYSEEGLSELEKIPTYEGDSSLLVACKNTLNFYKMEASEQFPVLTEFLLKKEQFEKYKKAFDLKSAKDRTQEDVDQYNKYVTETNQLADKYNKTNQALNKQRTALIAQWNKANSSFLSKYVPK
ncbi:hypothetical protein V6Z05_18450 [Leptospira venezuelensis]|uniref:LIC11966 family surface protein n=1 Tax=Leptospira venezuelensis TaxID=1958811 RepID=UPI000A39C1F8|nr:hypothetical protein [Leptospira venezuelensis]